MSVGRIANLRSCFWVGSRIRGCGRSNNLKVESLDEYRSVSRKTPLLCFTLIVLRGLKIYSCNVSLKKKKEKKETISRLSIKVTVCIIWPLSYQSRRSNLRYLRNARIFFRKRHGSRASISIIARHRAAKAFNLRCLWFPWHFHFLQTWQTRVITGSSRSKLHVRTFSRLYYISRSFPFYFQTIFLSFFPILFSPYFPNTCIV